MSNLSIFDAQTLQWAKNADFLSYCPAGKYTTLQGISFVSNLKFIEDTLLPRFQNISLILGLSDNGSNPIGQFLNGILEHRGQLAKEVYELEPIKQKILDGSLSLRFTKKGDELIHNKFYWTFNDSEYQCFIGSMNFTNNALNKNHEMLVRFSGKRDDDLFEAFKMFWNRAQAWSSGYFDAQHLKGLLAKSKKQTIINIYQDSVDRLEENQQEGLDLKDVYIVSQDELKSIRDKGDENKFSDFNGLSKKDKVVIKQVVSLTGDTGSLRQNKS